MDRLSLGIGGQSKSSVATRRPLKSANYLLVKAGTVLDPVPVKDRFSPAATSRQSNVP